MKTSREQLEALERLLKLSLLESGYSIKITDRTRQLHVKCIEDWIEWYKKPVNFIASAYRKIV